MREDEVKQFRARLMTAEEFFSRVTPVPRCIHGQVWSVCTKCKKEK